MKYLDIDLFYSLLTIDGKRALLELLEKDEELRIENYKEIEIKKWLEIEWVKQRSSVRLYNAIFHASFSDGRLFNKFLNDVDKEDVMGIRNFGEKSWKEFEKLRDEYNEALKVI
jgi:DNA-directed RNA polymerase alpha subunit